MNAVTTTNQIQALVIPARLPTPETVVPTLKEMRPYLPLLAGVARVVVANELLTKADLPALHSFLSEAQRLLVPATDIEVSQCVERLRRHYSNAPLSPDGWDDWVADLEGVPLDVLAAACRDWRRSDAKWAPTPGQLLAICVGFSIRQTLANRAREVIDLLEAS